MRSVAVLCVLMMVAFALPAQAAAGPVVWTDKGAVRGVASGEVRTFEGIPFAAPPTGDLRWRTPRPAAPWSGVRDATRPRANCMQSLEDPVPGPQSEDCLYLNVTTPRGPSRPRPVLIWLYGGGFYQGSASEYGAARLAAGGDVVVVTAGYRLGIFGFLGLPGLAESGAFGLADQQAAMRWVRRNIASFGGDPGNVTLVGESAGSMSTCAQLTSPTARGLFHRAIMQSGTCMIEWPAYGPDGGYSAFESAEVAQETGKAAAAAVGCSDVACLRDKPTEALLEGMSRFGPAFGNNVLPEHPAAALRAGRFHRVPVLVGTTRDEATLSITGAVANPLPPAEYLRMLDEDFGPFAARVAAEYPPRPGANGQTYASVHTDRTWAYTTWLAMREFASRVPTYAFEFADPDAPVYPGIPDPGFPLGAYHGSDVQYLFDIADFPPLPEPQRRLAATMIEYWSGFAAGDAPWPRWPHVRSLAPDAIGPVDYFCEHRLDFWATHGSNRLTSPNSCQR